MTREELVEILEVCLDGEFTRPDVLADRILSALEKEREGEVVLYTGDELWKMVNITGPNFNEIKRRFGQLIFRPTPADKEGV